MASAQQRVHALLEESITNIGITMGKQHYIKWIYLDTQGTSLETTTNSEGVSKVEVPAT